MITGQSVVSEIAPSDHFYRGARFASHRTDGRICEHTQPSGKRLGPGIAVLVPFNPQDRPLINPLELDASPRFQVASGNHWAPGPVRLRDEIGIFNIC